ncbi:MAG: ribonuclease Y [Candidatus Nealsonbacteria bacterium RIFCSPLOWO2_01_FULL_41_9]|uniref:Ribonuclease Y n=1 Tax=Candidatus Nealsonbacteria bacterium RIFCSPLOWO2_01_FULL_41_9 TaxID=1801671 RepID=A0A1G2ECS9_9BACT|nr:MAG: ribonuclease Y [Candidatus Nealsonbacteria bacterium RIFCSPLOWO2_01_FULL_41_9]
MNQLTLLLAGVVSFALGTVLGYYARQSLAKKRAGTIEQTLQKKIQKAREESEAILAGAKDKAREFLVSSKKETEERYQNILSTERLLLKRENFLNQRTLESEEQQKTLRGKSEELDKTKENLESIRKEALEKLEKIAGLKKSEAKAEMLSALEREYEAEVSEKIRKLETEGESRYEKKAKEILATAIQKYGLSQAQEITTTAFNLPSEEIKGRIIGKEGRNIKTLERLTGVEIVVDETPESVIISGFDPVRRQVAKIALEKLVKDGRIQPARIEEKVAEAQKEIASQMKEAGEAAVYDVGLLGLDPRLVQLLGRLKFRTSYGQNVLLHSIEVAHLAGALAAEIGADVQVCKKAGLLHDIGKAVDQEVEGSHIEIGIKILEKFGEAKEIIQAMRSHHEDYPYETLEAVLIQTADQISGARPGARKDTIENYLRRLADLENIALSFGGVEKAWALQAGREIRVFVKPEQIDDFGAQKLAKEIAKRIQDELRYPGEVKVNVIRETRVVEYAK